MFKLISSLLLLVFALLGASCASSVVVVAPSNKCERPDAYSVWLSGYVDQDMLDCARAQIDGRVDTIIVSSFGGTTKTGRQIGDIIARKPRTVIIRGACLSSCGNYFIPVAHKLKIEPGGFIGLHGTPDPWLMSKAGDKISLDSQAETLAAEDRFSRQYGIAHGWRLYRDTDSGGSPFTTGMTGKPRFLGGIRSNVKSTVLIVERPFIESCLPHVEIVEESIAATVFGDTETLKQVRSFGGIATGTLKCKPNTGQRKPGLNQGGGGNE